MTAQRITNWRKASASAQESSACVETGWADTAVGYRDSKQGSGPELWFPVSAARMFVGRIQAGGIAGAD